MLVDSGCETRKEMTVVGEWSSAIERAQAYTGSELIDQGPFHAAILTVKRIIMVTLDAIRQDNRDISANSIGFR